MKLRALPRRTNVAPGAGAVSIYEDRIYEATMANSIQTGP
jgi:hypothetical protein